MHHRHRRLLAAADAGCSHHAHAVAGERGLQLAHQALGAAEFTAQAVADAHCQAGGLLIALHDLKVVIEGGDLVDLGHRKIHFLGQRHQMPVVQAAVGVVELVQVLDQQIAPMATVRPFSNQGHHLGQGLCVGLTPLELALAPDAFPQIIDGGNCHRLHFALAARMVHLMSLNSYRWAQCQPLPPMGQIESEHAEIQKINDAAQ